MTRQIAYQLATPLQKTFGDVEIERRRAFLQSHAAPDTQILVQTVPQGYPSIESERDIIASGPHLLRGMQQAEANGAAAGIIGCLSDPAVDALREAVSMPVIAPCQASVAIASQLGDRFSFLWSLDQGIGRAHARMRAMGLADRLASIRAIGVPVAQFTSSNAELLPRIEAVCQQCIDDGATVLIMGCMSMAFMGIDAQLASRLEIPIVNPVIAAVKTAETLLDMGLSHSRKAWPTPPDRAYIS